MAETAPVSFADGQMSGLEELAGTSPAAINVIPDAAGAVRTRPGLSVWDEFPAVIPGASSVIGMWIWGEYLIYCTEDRKLWALISPGFVVALSDATAATQLDGSLRPQAVATRSRIVIIGGGVPQKWAGVGLSARLGGSPPAGNGIAGIATRLVISDVLNTGLFYWSDPGELTGHEVWNGDDASAEAESKPDRLLTLGNTTGELFAFGSETLQIFAPDDTAIFAPVTSREVGVLAAASAVKWGDQYAFLDDQRRIVATDGRTLTELSSPGMSKTIWNFATVSDCWAFRARFDDCELLGWVLPTEGRCCVYNATVQKWSEWRSLDAAGRWAPWVGQSHVYWPAKGIHLIGLADGRIVKLDPLAFTEVGNVLKAQVRTGFSNRETPNRKICQRLQVTMRRGAATSETAPQVELRWRDDLGAMSSPMRFSLGIAGDVEATAQKWTLGTPYVTRQWEITMSDAAQFVLASADETFVPLGA